MQVRSSEPSGSIFTRRFVSISAPGLAGCPLNRVWRLSLRLEVVGGELADTVRAGLAAAQATGYRFEFEEPGASPPDLMLVVGTPDWVACATARMRDAGEWGPLVGVLSSPATEKVSLILDTGADDCVAVPIDATELRARIRAVLRRSRVDVRLESAIELDPVSRVARVRDVVAQLSWRQFEIFRYLAERRERWVSSAEIVAGVCGTHHDEGTSLVRVHVHGLRKALGACGACIRSDGRKNYMLTLTDRGSAQTGQGSRDRSDEPSST
jgi:DNA-binding response OmpR family regulator